MADNTTTTLAGTAPTNTEQAMNDRWLTQLSGWCIQFSDIIFHVENVLDIDHSLVDYRIVLHQPKTGYIQFKDIYDVKGSIVLPHHDWNHSHIT